MEGIHNYYEQQVAAYLANMPHIMTEFDDNEISDIVCIALNRLPAKYYRHSIDLSFYMTSDEQGRIDRQISEAVGYATHKVRTNPRIADNVDH